MLQWKTVVPRGGVEDFCRDALLNPSSTVPLSRDSGYHAVQKESVGISRRAFYAFLQIVVIGIRNVEIIRSAKKLQEGLSSLQRFFDLFYKRYEEIGKNVIRFKEDYMKKII